MSGFSFGRRVEHDPRNRMFAAPDVPVGAVRDVLWVRHSPIIDQGELGCCTGAAMAGWLGCAPHAVSADEARAFDIACAHQLYSIATHLDSFPGFWPDDDTGSSGGAVAKAARKLRHISSWSWAFTTSGMLRALQSGPVLIGVPWYEGMCTPDRDSRLWDRGEVAGGHEVLIRGIQGRDLVLSNSWGTSWGDNGEALLPLEVWERLRKQQADVTVPRV